MLGRTTPVTVLLAAFLLGAAGCQSAVDPEQVEDVAGDDATAEASVDAAGDSLADSGCPAPARITPEMIPSGYLPVERVNLNYDVDGDTAHFYFASGDHILRYLFVDTEESNGAKTTEFGKASKAIMAKWLQEAKEIKVAVRQGSTAGSPDVDLYGRWLSLIFVDGELIQTRLVREGYSPYVTHFRYSFGGKSTYCAPTPVHEALLYAEAEAYANQRGIWAPGHPTDYKATLAEWTGPDKCRPIPYEGPYCK